jgi:DNA-binding transcriptional ArsR family regulator
MSTAKNMEALDIKTHDLKKAALYYRAINHKLRQQMLHLIDKKGEMMVTDIYVKLRIEQSVASQHLAILRRANLVTARREGKKIIYTVNYDQIGQLHIHAAALNNPPDNQELSSSSLS